MIIDFRRTYARAFSSSADRAVCWEDSASELGLATAPVEAPAEPAGSTSAGSDQPAEEPQAQSAESVAEPEDDDADVDPLDLLTERDDQDDASQQRTIEDRYKSLSKRARKLERTVKKQLPVVQALREAGVDLRSLLSRNQQLTNIEVAMERNPRLRALLTGGDPEDYATSGAQRQAPADEHVDYPFDTNDQVGRFMADFHKQSTTSQRTILDRLDSIERGLSQRVDRMEQGTVAQQRSAIMGQWKAAATAAAANLEPGVRQMFLDNVYSAARGYLTGEHKKTAQQIIDHYLKPMNVSKGQKDRASAAAGQRIADRNNSLPRRPAQGTGSPASVKASKPIRLDDLNRRIAATGR